MKILAFAEQREGVFKKSSFEVVHTARGIADKAGGEAIAIVAGDKIAAIAPALGKYGASRVKIVEDARLASYAPSAYAALIAEVAKAEQVTAVFIPATAMGKDLAPRVAVKLQAGLAADCTGMTVEGGDIMATRPVYAGKALLDVRITSPQKVFSLRPNVFAAGSGDGSDAPVEPATVALDDSHFVTVVKEFTKAAGKLDVAEADIIVSGGRGMRAPENFKIIEELADVLGAAVGASRAVVDAGWRPHSEQVGQTGKTVSPSLYVAVGISGAIQHLAGMSSSKYIVAINKDKDAPIFQVADYGITGDAFEIVPALTAEVKKLLGK